MRAARIAQKGTVEIISTPEPAPGPGEVLVRVIECGICGSDLHVYRGEWSAGSKIGHEICGVVERAGPDVAGLPPGTRVCAECFSHCGACRFCRRGDYNLCEAISFLPGIEHSGFAEKATLPAQALYRAPESLSDAQVMLVEPTAVAFRAVSRAGAGPGASLAVLGAGTIGLLCAAVARAAGASPVAVAAKHPHQAQMAEALGADFVVRIGEKSATQALTEAAAGRGFDAAVDTVARGASFSTALAAVRRRGRVVLVGGVTRPLLLNAGPLEDRELEVTGSQCYALTNGKPDFQSAIELIESGRVPAANLVTHTMPLEGAGEAFRIANDKSSGAIKVAVRMSD